MKHLLKSLLFKATGEYQPWVLVGYLLSAVVFIVTATKPGLQWYIVPAIITIILLAITGWKNLKIQKENQSTNETVPAEPFSLTVIGDSFLLAILIPVLGYLYSEIDNRFGSFLMFGAAVTFLILGVYMILHNRKIKH